MTECNGGSHGFTEFTDELGSWWKDDEFVLLTLTCGAGIFS